MPLKVVSHRPNNFIALLRIIAVNGIVVEHCLAQMQPSGDGMLLRFFAKGWVFLTFFFVLSGFLLCFGYQRNPNPVAFYLRRFSVVFPIYVLTTLLDIPALFLGTIQHSPLEGLKITLATLLFLQVWLPGYATQLNSPGWSVASIFACYLSFPVLFRWLDERFKSSQRWLIPGLLVLCNLSFVLYWALNPDGSGLPNAKSDGQWLGFAKTNPIVFLPSFALGMCAFFAKEWWPKSISVASFFACWFVLGGFLMLFPQDSTTYLLFRNGFFSGLFAVMLLAAHTWSVVWDTRVGVWIQGLAEAGIEVLLLHYFWIKVLLFAFGMQANFLFVVLVLMLTNLSAVLVKRYGFRAINKRVWEGLSGRFLAVNDGRNTKATKNLIS